MEFRLTYAGPLKGASRSNTRADHKHEIRRELHPQLRRLWEIAPQLNSDGMGSIVTYGAPNHPPHTVEALAEEFRCGEYKLVPLATRRLSLYCDIDVLFLRPDPPGSVLRSGDLDNRLKTLFDALRIPRNQDELGPYKLPGPDEEPFFCLLEDDSLITRVSVATDVLLEPVPGSLDENAARLVITVRLRPLRATPRNLSFV